MLARAAQAARPSLPQPMLNVVALWLEIIGTPERAARLLASYETAPWPGCPSVLLDGQAGSDSLYANPRYRPALDAWDTGYVTRRDVLCWAAHVAATSPPSRPSVPATCP